METSALIDEMHEGVFEKPELEEANVLGDAATKLLRGKGDALGK